MSSKRFLYLCLVLAMLLSGMVAPLVQPSVVVAAPPDTPNNLSPSNNATGVSLTPTLTASAFSDLDALDIHAASQWQITTTAGDYTFTEFDSGTDNVNLTSVVVPSATLSLSTVYYWHVRYRDNHGDWSIYSAEFSFTTINNPPNAPANQQPADGTTVGPTPTLQSSSFVDTDPGDTHAASQWQIALSTSHSTDPDGSYSTPVYNVVTNTPYLTSTTVPAATLTYSTVYYWHVRYQDNHGDWSAYSAEFSFTAANQAPATPTNVSPNAQTVSVTPTLTSSAFNDPGDTHAASQWQIRTVFGSYSSPAFESGRDNVNLTSIVVPTAAGLTYSTIYYWHVRHQDNNLVWSEWSAETWFVTSANQLPNRPVNSSPTGPGIGLTPTLTSSPFSDPDGDAHAASQWQITATSNNYSVTVFDNVTSTPNLTSVAVPSGRLSYNTTYYWHVMYQDNKGGWSEWSLETSFTTMANQPAATPTNLSPPANATVSLTPTLQSSPFSDDFWDTHVASRWQITTLLGNYTSPVFDSGIDIVNLTNTVIPSGTLVYSTTYYWHVSYRDNSGAWSDYSTETAFSTTPNNPPDPPTNSLPANLATGVSLTPTLESSAFSDDVGNTHAASQWQIRTVAGVYSSPVFDSDRDVSNLVSRVVPSGRLGYSTTYYWHVRHQDNNLAWSEWSAETSFTTVSNGAPDTPTNVSPANAATSVSITPALRSSAFSGPDGDTHAASQWQISTVAGAYSTPVFDSDRDASNLVSRVVPSGRLGYSTTYYWRVRYQNNRGTWSAWSAETSFATLNQGPSQPVNTLPANGATAVGRTSELRSSAFSTTDIGDSHTASQWQISSTSADYSDPVFDSKTDTEHLTRIAIPSGVLEYSETYYWRVRYQDSNDSWSPWSAETSFTTSAGASGMPFAGWLFIGIGAVAGVAALVYVTFFMKPAERK